MLFWLLFLPKYFYLSWAVTFLAHNPPSPWFLAFALNLQGKWFMLFPRSLIVSFSFLLVNTHITSSVVVDNNSLERLLCHFCPQAAFPAVTIHSTSDVLSPLPRLQDRADSHLLPYSLPMGHAFPPFVWPRCHWAELGLIWGFMLVSYGTAFVPGGRDLDAICLSRNSSRAWGGCSDLQWAELEWPENTSGQE